MSGPQQQSVRLGRSRRLALYVIGIGVWLTGGLWLLFHYFFVQQGEFGPQDNWSEPWWLKLHGAFAFAAIWMLGLLWGIHATRAWPFSRRRWSGGVMAGIVAWLILSGYLLYYVGDDKVRSVVSVLHWGIGLGVPLFFLWHRVSFRSRRANGPVNTIRIRNLLGSRTEPQVEPSVAAERSRRAIAPQVEVRESGTQPSETFESD